MTNVDQLSRLCSKEFSTLIWFGNAFLWIALISAVAVTLLTIIERLVALQKAPAETEAGGGGVSTLLDSVKGLVTALGQAPAWFAIFLAAILLLWAAPNFFGAKCVLLPTDSDKPAPASQSTTGSHANAPKGDAPGRPAP